MIDSGKKPRFIVQTVVYCFILTFCSTVLTAQNYGNFATDYVSQPSTNGNEMTIGEMLASQEIEARSNEQKQAVPVTMTGFYQKKNEPVSNAGYETSPQIPAAREAFPVQQTAMEEVKPQSPPEPRQLPEDFPTGEMAPLNAQSLISFSEVVTLPEGPFQQVTIIDPTQKVICVYHINMGTGQIELKSARKIEWDLQLIFLNSKKPLPQDVQAILQQTQRRK